MPTNRTASAKATPEVQNLDSRYGKIGISAVAAAMRYQSESRNTAYAPGCPPRGELALRGLGRLAASSKPLLLP